MTRRGLLATVAAMFGARKAKALIPWKPKVDYGISGAQREVLFGGARGGGKSFAASLVNPSQRLTREMFQQHVDQIMASRNHPQPYVHVWPPMTPENMAVVMNWRKR